MASDWASGWSRKSASGLMLTVDGVGVEALEQDSEGQSVE